MHAIADKESPIYLRELVQHVSETVSHSKLRFCDSNTFIKPCTGTKFAEQAIFFAGPAVWNAYVKTHYFRLAF